MKTRHRRRTPALRSIATLASALLFYYGVPLGFGFDRVGDVVGLVLFIIGVGGLIWLVVWQIRRFAVAPSHPATRTSGLLAILYLVVVFFALFYYGLELNTPGQFSGLATRTDALYYAVVTLGTVGYGDVHAVGQFARVVTMVQIGFDLVLIGTLLSVASSGLRQRLEAAAVQGSRGNRSPD